MTTFELKTLLKFTLKVLVARNSLKTKIQDLKSYRALSSAYKTFSQSLNETQAKLLSQLSYEQRTSGNVSSFLQEDQTYRHRVSLMSRTYDKLYDLKAKYGGVN